MNFQQHYYDIFSNKTYHYLCLLVLLICNLFIEFVMDFKSVLVLNFVCFKNLVCALFWDNLIQPNIELIKWDMMFVMFVVVHDSIGYCVLIFKNSCCNFQLPTKMYKFFTILLKKLYIALPSSFNFLPVCLSYFAFSSYKKCYRYFHAISYTDNV